MVEYKGEHSIIFGDKNLWDEYRLIPQTRPLVNPPSIRTEYLEIPGSDGALDYTEALSGLNYSSRTGEWQFIAVDEGREETWDELYSRLLLEIHGKEFNVVLTDDMLHYYHGRILVSQWASNSDYSGVTFNYTLDPFKYPIDYLAHEDWLWNDIPNVNIRYGRFYVDGVKHRNFVNDDAENSVDLYFYTSSDLKLHFNNVVYDLSKGANPHTKITLSPGKNLAYFEGNGYVIATYGSGWSI